MQTVQLLAIRITEIYIYSVFIASRRVRFPCKVHDGRGYRLLHVCSIRVPSAGITIGLDRGNLVILKGVGPSGASYEVIVYVFMHLCIYVFIYLSGQRPTFE